MIGAGGDDFADDDPDDAFAAHVSVDHLLLEHSDQTAAAVLAHGMMKEEEVVVSCSERVDVRLAD